VNLRIVHCGPLESVGRLLGHQDGGEHRRAARDGLVDPAQFVDGPAGAVRGHTQPLDGLGEHDRVPGLVAYLGEGVLGVRAASSTSHGTVAVICYVR
jgi:hypothetical protein